MIAVIQRVSRASVTVQDKVVGRIGLGMVILLGVAQDDQPQDIDTLVRKICSLRIFEDENGKMNLEAKDVSAEFLVVSQFTLLGDCRKGKRPSFDRAAEPGMAREYYERFIESVRAQGFSVQTGVFAAMMDVDLVNDGPVTLILDSKQLGLKE
jgi:D-tyrosyl-tRNA(Tyr) deacylase